MRDACQLVTPWQWNLYCKEMRLPFNFHSTIFILRFPMSFSISSIAPTARWAISATSLSTSFLTSENRNFQNCQGKGLVQRSTLCYLRLMLLQWPCIQCAIQLFPTCNYPFTRHRYIAVGDRLRRILFLEGSVELPDSENR